ncbi:MAG: SDR family oxidoreductase [Actinomycetota bacterium]|nr:SDR family oxidoreductase [Actinomycetota bacterium]
MDTGIAGKVAVVTGATRGIGAAMVRSLVAEGASVFGTGRSPESVETARAGLGDDRRNVVLAPADLNDPAAPERLVGLALETFGRIDFVINNAASFAYRSLAELTPADWQELAQQKLVAYSAIIDAARHQLVANRGAVVNVAGIAGCVPTGETPHVGAINAGILSTTRFYAALLAADGVRVNAVSPGDTDTDRRQDRLARLEATGLSRDGAERRLSSSIPLGRAVAPSEVAGVAVALCSVQFASVTGINVLVDGGRHVHYSVTQ